MPKFQSILLLTPDDQNSLKHHFNINLNETHLDTLVLHSDTSIGIDDIKMAKKFTATPPVIAACKYLIIQEANRLTPEAQNALLKLLEEPPPYLYIILTLTNLHQLLETVISRCQIINDSIPLDLTVAADALSPLLQLSPPERLNLLPATTTKAAAIIYCQQLIQTAAWQARHHPSSTTAHNLHTLLDCLVHLQQNTNPSLTIADAILLLLPLAVKPATMASVTRESQ